MKGKRIPEPPKPKAKYLASPSVEEKRIAELEAQLAEVTEQRDLWAKQCNMASEAQADTLSAASQLAGQKDAAYRERNQCVAALARLALANGWRAGLGRHQEPMEPADKMGHEPPAPWDPEWMTVVYIDLPSGQVSWHLHDSDVPLFAGLPAYARAWDGHSTEEKYHRLAALPANPSPSRVGALIEQARTVLSREAANGREVVAHEWARRVLVAAGEVEP